MALSDVEPRYLRTAEVAQQLGLSKSMVLKLIAARELPSVRFGHALRVPADGLEQYLKERERAN
jgi:excisionase family DNA binding protein